MPQTVDEVLAQATFYTDEYAYRLVHLPPNAITVAASVVAEAGHPFTALLVDKDEVTLLLEQEDYEQYQHRLRDHAASEARYRLITLDVELEPDLVGLMARISTALAAEDISILTFAAFQRDHIFVRAEDYDRAHTTLEQLRTTQSQPEDVE